MGELQMSWEDIIADKDFQAQPPEVKMEVAKNYFNKNIASDPDFKSQPQETQDVVLSNFFDTVRSEVTTEKKDKGFMESSAIQGALIDLKKFPGGKFVADLISNTPEDIENIKEGLRIIKERPSEALKAYPGSINKILGDIAGVAAGAVGGILGFPANTGVELARLVSKTYQTPDEQKRTQELTDTWKNQINTLYGLTESIGSADSRNMTEALFLPATVPLEVKNKLIDETSLNDTAKEWLKLGGDIAFLAGGGHIIEKKLNEVSRTGGFKDKSEALQYVKKDLDEAAVAREGLDVLSKSGDKDTKVMSKIALDSNNPDVMKEQIKTLLKKNSEGPNADVTPKVAEAMKKKREEQIANDAERMQQLIDYASTGVKKAGKSAEESATAMQKELGIKETKEAVSKLAPKEPDLAAGEEPNSYQLKERKKQTEEIYASEPVSDKLPLGEYLMEKRTRERTLEEMDKQIKDAETREKGKSEDARFNKAIESAEAFKGVSGKMMEMDALVKHTKDMGKTYLDLKSSIEELSARKKEAGISEQEQMRLQERIDQGKRSAEFLSTEMKKAEELVKEKEVKLEEEIPQKGELKGDKENISGVSGEIREGEKPIETRPVEAGGGEKVAGSGDVQAHEKERKSEVTELKITDIPDDLTVETTVSYTGKGKEVKKERNAREALSEKKADIDTFNSLLNCLKGK